MFSVTFHIYLKEPFKNAIFGWSGWFLLSSVSCASTLVRISKTFLRGSSRPPLTQRFDGALLRVLVLTGLSAGHQGGDGERVGPGRELRFRGRRVLHVGGGKGHQAEGTDQNIPLTNLEKSSRSSWRWSTSRGKPADLSCAHSLKRNLVEVCSDSCRAGGTPEAAARPAVCGRRICCSLGSSSPPLIIPVALQSGPSPPRHGPTVPAPLWYRATNERKAELSHKSVCACVCACVNSNILYQSHIRQIYLTLGHIDKKKLQILFFMTSNLKFQILLIWKWNLQRKDQSRFKV